MSSLIKVMSFENCSEAHLYGPQEGLYYTESMVNYKRSSLPIKQDECMDVAGAHKYPPVPQELSPLDSFWKKES